MARAPRIERPDGWYHVTARGNERKAIFRSERDRKHFCELLAEWVERFGVRLHAYVLMGNHYHLLVQTPQPNLSQALQWLNVSYSVWFNRRHRRSGHLFQGRFKAILFEPQASALLLSRYLHLNPVRVQALGLAKSDQRTLRQGLSAKPDPKVVAQRLAVLRSFRWSSYRAFVGLSPSPKWLCRKVVLDLLGGKAERREQAYRQSVEQEVREGLTSSPWEAVVEQVVLGTETFLKTLRQSWRGDERESPGLKRLRGLPSWERAVEVVETIKAETWDVFCNRHGDWGRDLALLLGRKRCGLKLRDLGRWAGGLDYVSVSTAIRRFEDRAVRDRNLAKTLRNALEQMPNEKM